MTEKISPQLSCTYLHEASKTLRETLCRAQNNIANRPLDHDTIEHDILAIGRLITEIDRHRPLGPDGKHGNLHTATSTRQPPHGNLHTETSTRRPPHGDLHTETSTRRPPHGDLRLRRPAVRLRTGRTLGRTLYLLADDGTEHCIGIIDTPQLAHQIVTAVNHQHQAERAAAAYLAKYPEQIEPAVDS